MKTAAKATAAARAMPATGLFRKRNVSPVLARAFGTTLPIQFETSHNITGTTTSRCRRLWSKIEYWKDRKKVVRQMAASGYEDGPRENLANCRNQGANKEAAPQIRINRTPGGTNPSRFRK